MPGTVMEHEATTTPPDDADVNNGNHDDEKPSLKVKDNLDGFELVTRNGVDDGNDEKTSEVNGRSDEENGQDEPENGEVMDTSDVPSPTGNAAEVSSEVVPSPGPDRDGPADTVVEVEEGDEETAKMEVDETSKDSEKKSDESEVQEQSNRTEEKPEEKLSAEDPEVAKSEEASKCDDTEDKENQENSAAKDDSSPAATESGEQKETAEKQKDEESKQEDKKADDETSKDDDDVVVLDDKTPTKNADDPKKKASKVDRVLENDKKRGSGSGDVTADGMRPFARLLYDLGLDMCRQQVYKDLVRVQKKKDSHNKLNDTEKQQLGKLKEAYSHLVDKNEPFIQDMISCEHCAFKADSVNAIENHKEYEHKGQCAICGETSQNIYAFYFHMEVEHNRQGRVHPVMGSYTCTYCPYEHHSSKKSFVKHLMKCEQHFKLNRNLQPIPADCDIALKMPPVAKKPVPPPQPLQRKQEIRPAANSRTHAPVAPLQAPTAPGTRQILIPPNIAQPGLPAYMTIQDQQGPQLVQVGSQYFLVVQQNGQTFITPMVTGGKANQTPIVQQAASAKPAAKPTTSRTVSAKETAPKHEICEICGGFVKDRESLRIHFFWAHKIEIHPSVMKESEPALKCQHCTKSFWTYQGYKRHCQTSHPSVKEFPQLMTCYVCNKQVPDFITHMTSKHTQVVKHMLSQIRCVVCQDAFPTESALESHMLNDHKDIVTKYGSMSGGTDKKSPAATNAKPAASKASPSYANMVKMCSRCPVKYTTSAAYRAHFNKFHAGEEEPCEVCDEMVEVGRPHIDHVLSKHTKKLTVPLNQVDDRQSTRKRQRSSEEVIVIDLDKGSKRSRREKPAEREEMEVIDADDIVNIDDKSDTSSVADRSEKNEEGNSSPRKYTEEIIDVDGEKVIVQKLEDD